MKFTWQFDKKSQVLRAPSGWTITVREIAQRLQDDTASRHNLSGDWTGWRIRGKVLSGPHGERITPSQLHGIAAPSMSKEVQ